MGGVDSLRGFLQDSLVPEDIAKRLLNPASGLVLNDVVIRGGDIFFNPRAELRIPLGSSVETAVFVDSGNLWTDPTHVNPLDLRYAVGTGLRIATPIGPLVFDYGFNVDRVLDQIFPKRDNQRFWEDLGAAVHGAVTCRSPRSEARDLPTSSTQPIVRPVAIEPVFRGCLSSAVSGVQLLLLVCECAQGDLLVRGAFLVVDDLGAGHSN
jgi:hypothetical protein